MSELVDLLLARFRELPDEPDGANGDRLPRHLWERALLGPAREFLRRPGKGLRARLVARGHALAGGSGDPPEELPAIVELLHAGSLILDDIQDGSDERRGAPALHHICGTPVALNTGNWLVFWPIQLLAEAPLAADALTAAQRRVAATLVSCHQGQALDLSLRVGELERADVPEVVALSTRLRTSSLTELAATLGGLAADAPREKIDALADLGRELGRALQMLDDLGGLVSDARRHKGLEDLRLGRPTWPWAWAAEASSAAEFDALAATSREVVGDGGDGEALRRRLGVAVETLGRSRARSALGRAQARLDRHFPPSAARDAVAADIDRLERSYG